jgi:integrase
VDRALASGARGRPFESARARLTLLSLHGLRHTFASLLVAIGKDPAYVRDQTGHKDAAFTLKVYAKVMQSSEGDRARLRQLVEGAVIEADTSAPLDDTARERASHGVG